MNNLTNHDVGTIRQVENDVLISGDIRHLLSRTTFGLSEREKKKFVSKSRKEVVSLLLDYELNPENLPLKDYGSIQSVNPDQKIDAGKTWIYDYNYDVSINEKRKYSLKNWMTGVLYSESAQSVFPKMLLFWNDFFSLEIKRITYAPRAFSYFSILRTHALGDYKELLTNVITDQALVYYNKKILPPTAKLYDYTVDQILNKYSLGPNYANYISKEKIKKLTRLLNKWFLICDSASLHYKNLKPREIYEVQNAHYMEAYFNRTDAREVVDEIKLLLDHVFKFPVAAENLSRKLCNWFLGSVENQEAYQKIILPLSRTFSDSGFDISAGLSSLFHNDFFYDERFRGCMVKSPLEFVFSFCRKAELYQLSNDAYANYPYWDWLRFKTALLGHDVGDPPGNNGWPVITVSDFEEMEKLQVILSPRSNLAERLLDEGFICKQQILQIDAVALARRCSNPSNPHILINFLLNIFYDIILPDGIVQKLMEVHLLDGTKNEHVWENRWVTAVERRDSAQFDILSLQLKALLKFLFSQKEFSLA